jgi:hypothetical protein
MEMNKCFVAVGVRACLFANASKSDAAADFHRGSSAYHGTTQRRCVDAAKRDYYLGDF